MTLVEPIWLMLAIPLAAALWFWRLPSRLIFGLRAAALALLLLAMAGLAISLPGRDGVVVVVADRSLSMPPDAQDRQKEIIDLVRSGMKPSHRLGVVSFGARAAVEQPPQNGGFGGFVAETSPDGSNLGEALERALSLIPRDAPGRVLVLSDGRWTGLQPSSLAPAFAALDVAIDFRCIERPAVSDLAIDRVEAPSSVAPGESFMVTAWVRSPVAQDVTLSFERDGRPLAHGPRSAPAGLSRHTFRDRAETSGAHAYALRVQSPARDPVPENNTARVLIGVSGPKPILCLTRSPNSGLARLLRAGQLDLTDRQPEQCQWNLEDLARYSAVIIENTPASRIGVNGLQNLAAWVKETGAGLMLTGGQNSFGPGGYYRSPLEPVLPVSMELRQEHRKLRMSMVITMDRSGSMAMPVGGGKAKMDLANLAASEAVKLLGPADEFAAVAVDSAPHLVVPMAPVGGRETDITSRLLSVQSMGGGIFIYVALEHAVSLMAQATADTKHIILFADAQDSEEPGAYRDLIARCRQAGVTISVIGLGKPTDCDAGLLRDIASLGGGQCYFTEDAHELPRLFAQDTFLVARSAFIDEPTPVRGTAAMTMLTGRPFEVDATVGGYNLCYLRPGASMAVVTHDEYKAPLVASWQAGQGRALCFTGEADGKYTGGIAQWPRVGDLMTSLARWTAGDNPGLGNDMVVTQEVRQGVCSVRLYTPPHLETTPFERPPRVRVLTGRPGRPPAAREVAMRWDAIDRLAADLPLEGSETMIATIETADHGRLSLPPVCLPYSPEFRPIQPGEGRPALERLAAGSNGVERVQLPDIWRDLPLRPRRLDIWPWLLFAAMVLFLLEILERRNGLVSAIRLPALGRLRLPNLLPSRRPPIPSPPPHVRPQAPTKATPVEPKPDPDAPSTLDAFTQARRSARRRMNQ